MQEKLNLQGDTTSVYSIQSNLKAIFKIGA